MRKEYKLTKKELETFFKNTKPQPAIYGSGGIPFFSTQQERANREWKKLGKKYGFKWDTVQSVPGKGQEYFTAEELEEASHETH